ncbi:hypothetical protein C8R43DRAFT_1010492 [Mycena crocata]|nr:hypothetical protein C8R43DRAFT_1010492 [Mycena crocata]
MPIIDSSLNFTFREKPEKICQWSHCPNEDAERKMKACAKCSSVRYCSKACQRFDWPQHKLHCEIPPVLDIGVWMMHYYDLFHWAIIEALNLRGDPTNLRRFGLWIDLDRMDRMVNRGQSQSPFLIKSAAVMSFEAMARDTGGTQLAPSDTGIAKTVAEGGVGNGVVVFCMSTVKGGKLLRLQHHKIWVIPPSGDPSSDVGWKRLIKGVVSGKIPMPTFSHMDEDDNESDSG